LAKEYADIFQPDKKQKPASGFILRTHNG